MICCQYSHAVIKISRLSIQKYCCAHSVSCFENRMPHINLPSRSLSVLYFWRANKADSSSVPIERHTSTYCESAYYTLSMFTEILLLNNGGAFAMYRSSSSSTPLRTSIEFNSYQDDIQTYLSQILHQLLFAILLVIWCLLSPIHDIVRMYLSSGILILKTFPQLFIWIISATFSISIAYESQKYSHEAHLKIVHQIRLKSGCEAPLHSHNGCFCPFSFNICEPIL